MNLLSRYKEALSYRRFKKSLRYAFRGVTRLFSSESNALIHLLFVVVVPILAALLRVSLVEWCILILCIGLVLSAEAVNTAVEKLSDRVSEDFSPLIKDAKDLAAGAVLILASASAVVGLLIFGRALVSML